MNKDSSVTTADILALISIMVAMMMGAIALRLWVDNQRLIQEQPKAKITQTFECR